MLDLRVVLLVILDRASNSSHDVDKKTTTTTTKVCNLGSIMIKLITWLMLATIVCFVLYFALASPPMHLVYDVAPPAGPSTIYIPGEIELSLGYRLDVHVVDRLTTSFHRRWIFWILVSSRLPSILGEFASVQLLLLFFWVFG